MVIHPICVFFKTTRGYLSHISLINMGHVSEISAANASWAPWSGCCSTQKPGDWLDFSMSKTLRQMGFNSNNGYCMCVYIVYIYTYVYNIYILGILTNKMNMSISSGFTCLVFWWGIHAISFFFFASPCGDGRFNQVPPEPLNIAWLMG